jgi:hypothetical protein
MAAGCSMRSTNSKSAFWLARSTQGMLLRLKAVATGLKDGSGDEGLDHILSEIDVRVAVELAKAGMN